MSTKDKHKRCRVERSRMESHATTCVQHETPQGSMKADVPHVSPCNSVFMGKKRSRSAMENARAFKTAMDVEKPIRCTNEDLLDQKCRRLAEIIASSKHLVAFTGAGVSTSTGLPDYRGEHGIKTSRRKKIWQSLDINELVPSKTHMALVELYQAGLLQYVITQNIDNLHLKSGLPESILTEVHGNATRAICDTCETVYTSRFPWNGLCDNPKCGSFGKPLEQRLRARTRYGNGRLKRHVISFDQPLGDIDRAIDECEIADVALVLGTSLRVQPFCKMAGEFADSLVIVNLQKTTSKLDRRAELSGVRLYADCDSVMTKVMQYLKNNADYQIAEWQGQHLSDVFVPENEDINLMDVLSGKSA